MAGKKKTVMNLKTTILSHDGKRRGQPHRIIAIENTRTLSELADVILKSFDFQNDHDYGFYDNMKSYEKSETGYESAGDTRKKGIFPGVKETNLSVAFNEISEYLFLFDYATRWKFSVKLESVSEYNRKDKYPSVHEIKGTAPAQYSFDDDDFELA